MEELRKERLAGSGQWKAWVTMLEIGGRMAGSGKSRSGKTSPLRIVFWKQIWVVKREDWLKKDQKGGCLSEKKARRLIMILYFTYR